MSPLAPGFRPMKCRELLALLSREFEYENVSTRGSHKKLKAPGRPTLTVAFADGETIGAHLIRRTLVMDVGLTLEDAKEVMRRA